MKKLVTLLVLPVMAFVAFVSIAPVGAQYQNVQNLYTQPTNDGSVDNMGVIGTEEGGKEDAFVNVVKGGINRVLGILALIALIILLWGGFMMVTASGEEDKYKKGFTILKQAAIGLIMIGIAWFVVSIIFWLVNIVTVSTPAAGTNA